MPVALTRSFPSSRRLVLVGVVFFILVLLLRTPTASYWKPYTSSTYLSGLTTHERDNTQPRRRLPQKWRDFLNWSPPNDGDHYPPYHNYGDRDYDPNRWEGFEQNTAFFLNGSISRLESADPKPVTFLPYPEYHSEEYLATWHGRFTPCPGPGGKPVDGNSDVLTLAHQGLPEGFPSPDVGSWDAVGLTSDMCFDRHSRLGPYGLSDDESGNMRHDLVHAQWGKLQEECVQANAGRYRDTRPTSMRPGTRPARSADPRQEQDSSKQYKSRSALLIRTWDNYEYQDNDIMAIRSLVSELNLQSGGEYSVFLLVNIKDLEAPIYTDSSLYREYLEKSVPEELRDIAILWTEAVCQEWYPRVGEWSVYWQQFMPLQWFAKTHPEYDYIWNWEMDARLIGQHYHFFEAIATFARNQPRKYLWERNSRYYFPAKHGSWKEYFSDTNKLVEQSKAHQSTVWGPQPWTPDQNTLGPKPPRDESSDNFEWGVGEDADLITLLPIWDPRETWWSYRDRLFNYPHTDDSTEEREFPHIPRRVFINTLVRFSTKLLDAMHLENEAGLSMASEVWPASAALQHGYKAVYAPHPIWQSHIWDPDYMEMVFNADGWGAGSKPNSTIDDGRGVAYNIERDESGEIQNGTGPNREGKVARWSQERDAPYSSDREHNFAGWSWYFWSDYPRIIYWRWLGWPAAYKSVTATGSRVIDALGMAGGPEWEEKHGRLCLPHMLLHPVKKVVRNEEDEKL